MTTGRWICPACYSRRCGPSACPCGSRRLCLGKIADGWLFVGHLHLLADVPFARELLAPHGDGPRRRWEGALGRPAALCRQRGRWVWLWQSGAGILPESPSAFAGTLGARLVATLRALSLSRALLLELSGTDGHFQARFARSQRGRRPPGLQEMLERVTLALKMSGAAPARLAIVDPGLSAAAIERAAGLAGLAGLGAPVLACPSRAEALARLLEGLGGANPGARQVRFALHHAHLMLADLGDGPCRDLFQGLRRVQGRVRDLGLGFRPRVRPEATEPESPGTAGPGSGAATGSVRCTLERRLRVPLEVTCHYWRDAPRPDAAGAGDSGMSALVGIGAPGSGRRDLEDLLEEHWSGRIQPAALLVGAGSDERLLRMATREFPGAEPFFDTRSGRVAGLLHTLKRAR